MGNLPDPDCQKGLAEFAPAGANKVQSIFAGGVYVGKNTSRLANVQRVSFESVSKILF